MYSGRKYSSLLQIVCIIFHLLHTDFVTCTLLLHERYTSVTSLNGAERVMENVDSIRLCSQWCLGDDNCTAFSYQEKRCGLITEGDVGTISSNNLHKFVCGRGWATPQGWTGASPRLYLNFESTKCAVELHGSTFSVGKIGQGLDNNASPNHAHLGTYPDECWPAPDTCADGASIALWVKVKEVPSSVLGIITTISFANQGFRVPYDASNFQLAVFVSPNVAFQVYGSLVLEWVHHVVVWKNSGRFIEAYQNGVSVGTDSVSGTTSVHGAAAKKLVFGRYFYLHNDKTGNVKIDEFLAFDFPLTYAQVGILYGSYS